MSSDKKTVWQYWLKPTPHEALKKKRVYGFDIETKNYNKDFLIGCICSDNFLKFFYSNEEMIAFIKNNGSALYAATNLQFDSLQLFKVMKRLGGFKPTFRQSDMIAGRWEKAKFVDTMNYARMGVKKIGKIIGIEKMKNPDFTKVPSDEDSWNYMRRYNHNDAWISYSFYRFLENFCLQNNIKLKLTIASTAMDDFQRNFLAICLKKTRLEDYNRQVLGYYGGRCEVFARGNITGMKLRYYDVRSMYPFIMRSLKSPNPNSMRYFKKGKVRFIEEFEGLVNCEIFCPKMKYPFLPFRDKGKLCFPTGDISGWYTHAEIRKALSLKYVLKAVRDQYVYYYEFMPFRDYVDKHYKARMKYKAEGSPLEFFEKIMLNSLYGKFGSRPEREEAISLDDVTLEMLEGLPFKGGRDFIFVKRHLDDDETPPFTIPILAIYITSHARIKLYDLIVKHQAIYCDTDSIICKDVIEDSPELGGLKFEAEILEGVIIKPKMYVMNDDIKVKGMRFNRDSDDPNALRENLVKLESIFGGEKIPMVHFAKMKECQIRQDLYYNQPFDIFKFFDLEDDKRRWDHLFSRSEFQESEPLHSNGGVLNSRRNELILSRIQARQSKKIMAKIAESDLFDRQSVGYDVSDSDFIKNEQWFALRDL